MSLSQTDIPAVAFGFASSLADDINEDVTILSTAEGGQEIDRYIATDPNPSLWTALQQVYTEAGSPQIHATTMVQGEADHGEASARAYLRKVSIMRAQMEDLFDQTDFTTYSSIPYNGPDASVRARRGDGWRLASHVLPNHHVVETADLTASDGVHLDELDLITVGRRMHQKSHPAVAQHVFPVLAKAGSVTRFESPWPATFSIEAQNGSRIHFPNCQPIGGSVVNIVALGSSVLTEDGDSTVPSYGFYSLTSGVKSKITLTRGLWQFMAMPSFRRWHYARLA